MQLTDQLLTVARAYSAAREVSMARISTLIFNDGKKFDLLERGKDLGTKTHEKAMQWFSDRWPDGTDWPADVVRPAPAEAAA